MDERRGAICASTARKLTAAADRLPGLRALVGFDGFVDEIIAVVGTKHADGGYDPVRTIGDLGRKIRDAEGQSTNYELVVRERKLGGNGPILANALASCGLDVTYIGSVGFPRLDPVFAEFATHATVLGIAEPGHTDALEFEDGKLMLGKLGPLADVTWANLVDRVGQEALRQQVARARLIGLVNWTMLPHMSAIWERLIEILPADPGPFPRTLFIDLADPEKRTAADLSGALALLTRFQERVEVILGLNLKEAGEVCQALGLPTATNPEADCADLAAAIREKLDLACVVIHPRRGASAATRGGLASIAGPFIRQPKISTGAGDHFNAGFCLGHILGFSSEESLCAGVACSGYFVRTGMSPTMPELAEFIAEMPTPE